ncbi:hypothetical protein LMG28138_06006 [Pararobbsia alpina]|uniref:Uncharacterized protein n=1 Tax=Pararobbsia alpina TaxID=621374 RepID=A0A6S7D665_9BURK|nr:hypothetical protein LMG28138_06006 [Pararobbsia alpina]
MGQHTRQSISHPVGVLRTLVENTCQRIYRNRLEQITIEGMTVQPHVDLLGACQRVDEGTVRPLGIAQCSKHFYSRHIGQTQVQKHNIGLFFTGSLKPRRAVVGRSRLVTHLKSQLGQNVGEVLVVINE